MWARGRGQTDTETQTRVTTVHFALSTNHEKCNEKENGSLHKNGQQNTTKTASEDLLSVGNAFKL